MENQEASFPPPLPLRTHLEQWTSDVVGFVTLRLKFCENQEEQAYTLEALRMTFLS